MKNIIKHTIKYASGVLAAMVFLGSCSKFTEINTDPTAASEDQVQVAYLINNSIIGAQMNPDVAERSFVLYWEAAGRQVSDYDGGAINVANYDDGWTSNYFNAAAGWMTRINKAIEVAQKRVDTKENLKEYTANLLEVARIWRVYLMSELTDNFGPIPIDAFKAANPEYADVKDVYYFMLAELKDATSKLDLSIVNPEGLDKQDPAFGYDYTKWKKYGNSMRLRLAMRLSEVDKAKAQAEFEDAAKSMDFLITDLSDNFQVQEKDGWDDLSGVMSRSWDTQPLSVTLCNLYVGLGGVKSADQLGAAFDSYIKPANWMGERYLDYFATMNNDPHAGYWLNGLPYTIDPRAYKAYSIPGDITNPNYPKQNGDYDLISIRDLKKKVADTLQTVKKIDAKYSWNARIDGAWGDKDQLNQLVNYGGTLPRINMQFRNSTQKRIFFAPWETYFLLAEAKVRGWNTPISAKVAYEDGIKASFEYWGISSYLTTYLSSTGYNRCGTSVSWDNTTEPPTSISMQYKDGITGVTGTVNMKYPVNGLYKGGAVKNDLLTKIITQKFIAQVPWLPLESWSDHRRLGLPFFENPTVEKAISTLPALTSSNYMTSNIKFLPQRLKYPSGLKNQNPKGYQQATGFLGAGGDEILTPLWWAQH